MHHSDTAFSTSTALRFHPGEVLLSVPLRLAVVGLLGIPVSAVIAFEAAFAFANFFEHSDVRLPREADRVLSALWITPALHRLHHSQTREERNSNYGTIFSLWDRVFRSLFYSDSERRVAVGLPGLDQPIRFRAAVTLPLGRPLIER